MWYLHGDEQQGRIAQLQSLSVYKVLPELVSNCYFINHVHSFPNTSQLANWIQISLLPLHKF